MSTDNICLYKEVARKYTCCNLKTTELLDYALIGVCAVIRSNTVFCIELFVSYNLILSGSLWKNKESFVRMLITLRKHVATLKKPILHIS